MERERGREGEGEGQWAHGQPFLGWTTEYSFEKLSVTGTTGPIILSTWSIVDQSNWSHYHNWKKVGRKKATEGERNRKTEREKEALTLANWRWLGPLAPIWAQDLLWTSQIEAFITVVRYDCSCRIVAQHWWVWHSIPQYTRVATHYTCNKLLPVLFKIFLGLFHHCGQVGVSLWGNILWYDISCGIVT